MGSGVGSMCCGRLSGRGGCCGGWGANLTKGEKLG